MRRSLLLLVVPLALGCSEPDPGPRLDVRRARGQPVDAPVLSFGDDAYAADDLQAILDALPARQRARLSDPSERRRWLQRLIDFELLAREAARRELHQRPDVLEVTKRLMVERLLEEEREKVTAGITDADLEAWFEAHREDFQRPAEVQVSHLFLAHPPGPLPAMLQEKTEALAAASEALALHDAAGFAALVQAHSDDPHSRPLGGDLRFRSHAELSERFGDAVADAAFALKTPGARSGWIQGARGLHLLRLTARRPALALSLQQPQTRERVRRAVLKDRQARAEAALLERLGREAGVELHNLQLGALRWDGPTPHPERPGVRSNLPPGTPSDTPPSAPPAAEQGPGGELSPSPSGPLKSGG